MTTDRLMRRERLAEAAERYYVLGWSQERVAGHLETSRSNVSRLLEAARREGVIRFVIDHPLRRHNALEAEISDRWRLRHVAVVADQGTGAIDRVGRLAAGRLLDHLADAHRIALGWGTTVEATVSQVEVERAYDVEVVQVGGDLSMPTSASGHQLVRELAGRLGGGYSFLPAPALMESPQLTRQVLADRSIREQLDRARGAAVALVGIGRPGVGFAERAFAEDYGRDGEAEAVICARLVDSAGRELEGPLRDRVVALTLDDLRAIPHVIGVAAGAEKAGAVRAALNGRLVDELVCDQALAAGILRITEGAVHAEA